MSRRRRLHPPQHPQAQRLVDFLFILTYIFFRELNREDNMEWYIPWWFVFSVTSLALGDVLFFMLMCPVLLIGGISNNYVMFINGGQMPIQDRSMSLLGAYYLKKNPHLRLMSEMARVRAYVLCDIIPLRLPGRTLIASVGDGLLVIGKGTTILYANVLLLRFIWFSAPVLRNLFGLE
ncbi:MAG: DUF5317 family protein [bacterium]|nr:DUF5317 family protein [bacterium]